MARTRRTAKKTIAPATRINPTHRVSAPTHAASVEVEGIEQAQMALAVLRRHEVGHDWTITEIN